MFIRHAEHPRKSTDTAQPINLSELRRKIRFAEEPDNPALIGQWLATDHCCQQQSDLSRRGINPCQNCTRTQQYQHYEQQFRLLLETLEDELLPKNWRCSCLDQIYKPLAHLRQLCDTTYCSAQLNRLIWELRISSHYSSLNY